MLWGLVGAIVALSANDAFALGRRGRGCNDMRQEVITVKEPEPAVAAPKNLSQIQAKDILNTVQIVNTCPTRSSFLDMVPVSGVNFNGLAEINARRSLPDVPMRAVLPASSVATK
jgi:hypothetical protein